MENKEPRKNEKEKTIPASRMTAYIGVFTALALLLSYIESLIPVFLAVPGVKLGLANLVTIVALFKLGVLPAAGISLCRILLSGILFGNLTMILYSLAGATLSLLVMWALKHCRIFFVTGVSIAGAVAHNAGQLAVAAFLLENGSMFYYMCVLAISGAVSGLLIGLLAGSIIRRIRI